MNNHALYAHHIVLGVYTPSKGIDYRHITYLPELEFIGARLTFSLVREYVRVLIYKDLWTDVPPPLDKRLSIEIARYVVRDNHPELIATGERFDEYRHTRIDFNE